MNSRHWREHTDVRRQFLGRRLTRTLRNRGEPTGFSKVAAPMIARAMRRANEKDLARLKAILEARVTV